MIEIYTKIGCPYCTRALSLLNKKQVKFTEIKIDGNNELRSQMIERAKHHTVPQIFIDDQSIGGCDDLYLLESQGKLDELLKSHKN